MSKGDISMKNLLILLLAATMVVVSSCSQKKPDKFILVKGGTFKNTKSNLFGKGVTVSDFYISTYEVTQKEWVEIMGNNPSEFKGDNLPVEMVSWYDCIEYCNQRSKKDTLKPYYNIEKNKIDTANMSGIDSIKWTVTINTEANGYRLPTEVEWEYAAGGGQLSKSFTYSGSNNIDEVAWYYRNSGNKIITGEWFRAAIKSNKNKTKPIGIKKPNELGLYDMSGNVREWCWDWFGDLLINNKGADRALRGGGWLGGDQACTLSFRGNNAANSRYNDTGIRVCRGK